MTFWSQVLEGASKEQRENLGITTPDYYLYLNQSGTYTVEDVNDKKEFAETMVCLSPSFSLFVAFYLSISPYPKSFSLTWFS